MLTDTKVRQAKPAKRSYKLSDSGGLYLFVSGAGAKSWRYDYRLAGRRQTLTIGRYPEVTLAEARGRHAEARRQLDRGESPSLTRKREKQAAVLGAANTFEALAETWFAELAPHRSESWRTSSRRWLQQRIYPAVGSVPVKEIQPADVLAIIRRIADSGYPRTAEYVRQTMARVFEFAIRNLRANQNPAREVRGAITLPKPKSRDPLPAKEIPEFLEKLDADAGNLPTKLAIKLLLLTFVRKNELLGANWDEIDLGIGEWRIPAERMKMRDPHIVPLSRQAVEAFKDLKALVTGSTYVFPNIGTPSKHMGKSTLNKAFDRMGYGGRFTPHGLRVTASTILNEQGYRPDVIERQLAHSERNRVRAAYNRADYLAERRKLVQDWADYLDALCAGADIVNIKSGHPM